MIELIKTWRIRGAAEKLYGPTLSTDLLIDSLLPVNTSQERVIYNLPPHGAAIHQDAGVDS